MYYPHRNEPLTGPNGVPPIVDVRLTHPLLDGVLVSPEDAATAAQWAEQLYLWKAGQSATKSSTKPNQALENWLTEQLRLASSSALSDWKCTLLGKVGLTYKTHSDNPDPVKARLTARQKQVRERVEAFKHYGVSSERFHFSVPDDPVAGLLARYVQRIVARAQMFSQPLRVQWKAPMLTRSSSWWLWGIEQRQELETRGGFHLALHRGNANGDGVEEFITAEVNNVLSCGYSADGAYYQLQVLCEDGSELTIDYDAYLSDQSHQHIALAHFGEIPCAVPVLPFDWDSWLASPSCPTRFTTAESTASKAFNMAFAKLQAFCLAHPAEAPRSTGAGRATYRFVEHMLEKKAQGSLPRSHRERLGMLDFVWGRQKTTSFDLFSHKS